MASYLKILRDARELISDPKRWAQGQAARSVNGVGVLPNDARAVCWCSLGALHKVCVMNGLNYVDHNNLLIEMLNNVASPNIVAFNDAHPHAEVISKWDEAIAKLEAAA